MILKYHSVPNWSVAKQKKHSRLSDAIRDNFITKVHNIVNDDPIKSIQAIARKLQLHQKTVWHCIHKDLCYSSYVMRWGQPRTQQTKENCYKKNQKAVA